MPGLLVAGMLIPIPGVTIISPGDFPWAKLDPADYRQRKTKWVRQVIIHTTKGNWPQHVIPGAGPGGKDKAVADFWRGDPTHSGAQVVIDNDGSVLCLADLVTCAAYHATTSNDWSVGIEMYQEGNSGIYEAVLLTLEKLLPVLCEALGIPFQVHSAAYHNLPVNRMKSGGADCVGIFGHRDNAWDSARHTSTRGRGDPGDLAYAHAVKAGAETFDFDQHQDLDAWSRRQSYLNALGEHLKTDGIAGPGTMGAMRRRGFSSGREIDAARE